MRFIPAKASYWSLLLQMHWVLYTAADTSIFPAVPYFFGSKRLWRLVAQHVVGFG
jgi:hypothetical protein